MTQGDWRARLRQALENSGRSMRAVSLAAKRGPGYLFSILDEGKDPTVDNLVAICEVLNVSVTKILLGTDVSPEDEKILSQLGNPERRRKLLEFLQTEA